MRMGLGLRDLSIVACPTNIAPFNPTSLFASGEQGVWFDPSDFSTLFQDSAGTTPVTAAGQSVGKMLDKSGRANHVTQPTAGKLPILQQDGNGKYYLAVDGVNDCMFTSGPSVPFAASSTFAAAILYTNTTTFGVAMTGNQMYIAADVGNTYSYGQGVGTSVGTRTAAPHVQIANFRSNATSSMEVDKTTISTANVGSLVDNTQVFLFSSGTGLSSFMSGNFYGGIMLARALSGSEKAGLYTYLGAKAGLVL
jgi:hypothetical protein